MRAEVEANKKEIMEKFELVKKGKVINFSSL